MSVGDADAGRRSPNGAARLRTIAQPEPRTRSRRSAVVKQQTSLEKTLYVPPPRREEFYTDIIEQLARSEIPFLLSGTYALAFYTGSVRPTKDVDLFATAGDCLKILAYFKDKGVDVEIVDDRWLARITKGEMFVDVIFNMPTASTHVTEDWFDNSPRAELFGSEVHLVPPTEFVWSKMFVQDRYRYDGADVAHTILKRHAEIDWRRLLNHMELHWEVLLIHLLNFRYIYPSERDCLPQWLLDELLDRLKVQNSIPPPGMKVCRGRIFSPRDYVTDVTEWGFSEPVGNLEEQYKEPAR
jgi:hypothetical protein